MKHSSRPLPGLYFPAAFVAGLLAIVAFAPFNVYPLSCLCLGLLYAGLRRAARLRQCLLLGFLWGLGCFLGGVSWVYVSMHHVGGMAAPLAASATLAFAALLAAYPAIACGLWFWLRRSRTTHSLSDCLLFAAAWTLGEWLRGTLFTGFPWLTTGYSHATGPLGAYAPVVGIYGVSFVTALMAALLAVFIARPKRGRVAATGITLLVLGGLALTPIRWTTPSGEPLSVSLLQGNIPQTIKWVPERLPLSLHTYRELASTHPADLMVLPETAIPLMFGEIPRDYLHSLNHGKPLMIGAATGLDGQRYANAAVLLAAHTAPVRYLKQHLVPFGEYVPPGFAWFFNFIHIPMTGFTAGEAKQSPLTLGEIKIAPNICYEDLFGEEIIRALPEANLLINLSNTAWFGDSLAQPQHLQIAQMRARETGRMMLRATNTGMTAAIGPNGKLIAMLAPFTRDVLSVSAQGYSGSTPYVFTGNAPILILVLAVLIGAYNARRP